MTVTIPGRRIELVPMDPHCGDISIALYARQNQGELAVVWTFSRRPGAAERVKAVARSIAVLAGLEPVEGRPATLRFGCGDWHEAALRRAFLEACKLGPDGEPAVRPLEVHDRQTGQAIRAVHIGGGTYRVEASGIEESQTSRAPAVARGLAKLAQLDPGPDDVTVAFPCGARHDALVGLLLPRALNVRAVIREEEMQAARGVLSAPSARQE